jgi:hypothetical protein
MNSAIRHMMAPAASRVLRACLAHAWRLTLEAPGLRHALTVHARAAREAAWGHRVLNSTIRATLL